MLDAVSPECLTPVSTVVAAYDEFLSDNNYQTGEAVECSVDKQLLVPKTEYCDGRFSKRACTVWDPLFQMMHGEKSGLEEAMP